MDTRFLESFSAVVEHGSMAEAARRLNLTPAAIAQRIRALEAEFGVSLLTRIGRTVKPTEAGAAIFAKAAPFLRELQILRSASSDDLPAGELRLGAVSTALTGILPAILSRLHVYPRLGVYVAPGTSSDLYRRVIEGDLDVAILVHPPFPIPKICDWRILREEPLLVLGPDSARHRDPLDLLATEPFIRYDRNHWGGRLADEYLRHIGIRPKERFELDALEAIAVLVDRGLGVSVVPDWAPPWPAGLSITRWQVSGSNFMRRIGLVWTKASPRLRLVNALLEEAAIVSKAPTIGY